MQFFSPHRRFAAPEKSTMRPRTTFLGLGLLATGLLLCTGRTAEAQRFGHGHMMMPRPFMMPMSGHPSMMMHPMMMNSMMMQQPSMPMSPTTISPGMTTTPQQSMLNQPTMQQPMLHQPIFQQAFSQHGNAHHLTQPSTVVFPVGVRQAVPFVPPGFTAVPNAAFVPMAQALSTLPATTAGLSNPFSNPYTLAGLGAYGGYGGGYGGYGGYGGGYGGYGGGYGGTGSSGYGANNSGYGMSALSSNANPYVPTTMPDAATSFAKLYGNGSTGSAPSKTTPTKTTIVNVYDGFFQPAKITVSAGTTVKWMNFGAQKHTITSDNDRWDSVELTPGGSTSVTFTEAGTYNFHCRIHPKTMRGAVVVE
jgi:plastocyanin